MFCNWWKAKSRSGFPRILSSLKRCVLESILWKQVFDTVLTSVLYKLPSVTKHRRASQMWDVQQQQINCPLLIVQQDVWRHLVFLLLAFVTKCSFFKKMASCCNGLKKAKAVETLASYTSNPHFLNEHPDWNRWIRSVVWVWGSGII